MELLEVELPKNITIGKGAIEKIGEICENLEMNTIATVFTDDVVKCIAADRITEILEKYGFMPNCVVLPKMLNLDQQFSQ